MATWRRKRKRQMWSGSVEYAWSTYQEKNDTDAHWCFWEIDDSGAGRMLTKPAVGPCVDVEEALRLLRTGERAVVAGSDMAALRERLQA